MKATFNLEDGRELVDAAFEDESILLEVVVSGDVPSKWDAGAVLREAFGDEFQEIVVSDITTTDGETHIHAAGNLRT